MKKFLNIDAIIERAEKALLPKIADLLEFDTDFIENDGRLILLVTTYWDNKLVSQVETDMEQLVDIIVDRVASK